MANSYTPPVYTAVNYTFAGTYSPPSYLIAAFTFQATEVDCVPSSDILKLQDSGSTVLICADEISANGTLSIQGSQGTVLICADEISANGTLVLSSTQQQIALGNAPIIAANAIIGVIDSASSISGDLVNITSGNSTLALSSLQQQIWYSVPWTPPTDGQINFVFAELYYPYLFEPYNVDFGFGGLEVITQPIPTTLIIQDSGSVALNADIIASANSIIGISGSQDVINLLDSVQCSSSVLNISSSVAVSQTSFDPTVTSTVPSTVTTVTTSTITTADGNLINATTTTVTTTNSTGQTVTTTVQTSGMSIGGNQPNDLPSGLCNTIRGLYVEADYVPTTMDFSYRQGTPTPIIVRGCMEESFPVDTTIDSSTGSYYQLDISNRESFRDTVPVDVMTDSPFMAFFLVDESTRMCIDSLYPNEPSTRIPYLEPGGKDVKTRIDYGLISHVDDHRYFPFGHIGYADASHRTCYGPKSYLQNCDFQYYPPTNGYGVTFDVSFTSTVNPQPHFVMTTQSSAEYCPYQHAWTGPRDTGIPGTPVVDVNPTFITQEAYYMLNTVLVKRLPDNVPIEVLSVSATIDEKSWLWQFNIVIGAEKYLNLIKPDISNADIFYDIEISINGWYWTCRVESYSETRRFGKDAWSITGRSPSMELGSPQNPPLSYTFDPLGTSVTAGAQIIDDILAGTMLNVTNLGWTADWSFYNNTVGVFSGFNPYDGSNWGIPPNTFSWSNLTQIEAINKLLSSIGVYAQTNPDTNSAKTLIMKPLFSIPPWHWLETSDTYFPTINATIADATFYEVGRQYKCNTPYNAVYVMGQKTTGAQGTNSTGGVVFTNIYRTGFAGTEQIHAPNIADQWLTTAAACSERGRMELCKSGEWMTHSLKLFSLAQNGSTTSNLNGLITPAEFVAINEKGVTWFGQVTGTTVTANITNGSAFHVEQVLNIEQYVGN